ncbi:MAG: DNA-3-methyladenine glycosylase family protein [Candidatus Kariarchaeaceae archaeon]|jgi:DNA-3-methyladenine glycosylase II
MPNILTEQVLDNFAKNAPEVKTYLKKAEMVLEPSFTPPYESLSRTIIYQQLAYKAASTIHDRFLDLIGSLTPISALSKSQEELRSVGLSRQKASYIHNLAEAFGKGGLLEEYNDLKELEKLSSNEIIKLFSQVKGVGEWTVQMYLIFNLGRLDVLSPGDLGVRKGIMKMYKLKELPTPGQIKKLTEHWHPLETVGTYLAWRVVDDE